MSYRDHNSFRGHSDSDHQSFLQKFLRALISLSTTIGFTMFWYALAVGISNSTLHFVCGIILMLLGFFHILVGIRKDISHRRGH